MIVVFPKKKVKLPTATNSYFYLVVLLLKQFYKGKMFSSKVREMEKEAAGSVIILLKINLFRFGPAAHKNYPLTESHFI